MRKVKCRRLSKESFLWLRSCSPESGKSEFKSLSLPSPLRSSTYWTSLVSVLIRKMGGCSYHIRKQVGNSYFTSTPCHHHFHYILHPQSHLTYILKTNLFQTISGRPLLLMSLKQRMKDFMISISTPLIFQMPTNHP